MLRTRDRYMVLSLTQPEYMYPLNQRVEVREAPLTVTPKKKHWHPATVSSSGLEVLVPNEKMLLSKAQWSHWFGKWNCHLGLVMLNQQTRKKKELLYRLEWLITVANGKLNCPYTVGNKEDYFWNPEYFHAQWWRLIENYSKQTKEKVKTLEESDPSEMTVWVTLPGWEPSIT